MAATLASFALGVVGEDSVDILDLKRQVKLKELRRVSVFKEHGCGVLVVECEWRMDEEVILAKGSSAWSSKLGHKDHAHSLASSYSPSERSRS